MALVGNFDRQQRKEVRKLQRSLYLMLLDYLTEGLSPDKDGLIKSTSSNYRSIRKLDAVKRAFQRDFAIPFLTKIAKRLFGRLHDANTKYFADVASKTQVQRASRASKDKMREVFGFKTKKLVPGGTLDRISGMDDIWDKIRRDALNAVASRLPLSDFMNRIKQYTTGDKKRDGEVVRYFNRVTGDIYNQYERAQSMDMADQLGLAFGIYQGGLIKTSRPFCEHRNNKVFSKEEILKFGTRFDVFGGYTDKSRGEFQGKNANYNPLRDLGGYNCRHRIDWISAQVAYRLRPELRDAA